MKNVFVLLQEFFVEILFFWLVEEYYLMFLDEVICNIYFFKNFELLWKV